MKAPSLNTKLKGHFDAVMAQNPAPLFESYETYKASLPFRKIMQRREPLKLVDLPFFAREEDLQVTVKRLEYQSNQARGLVRYVVSPTCTGKTASICAAFLLLMSAAKSDDYHGKSFSHYLYLAFANNGGRRFDVENSSDISKEERGIAETQGAAFMVGCLRKLLNCEYGAVRVPTEHEILMGMKGPLSNRLLWNVEIFLPQRSMQDGSWSMSTNIER